MTSYQRTDDPALLAEENAHLLDDLEVVYNQFILLKNETDVSYAQLRSRNKDLERNVEELGRAYNQLEATRDQLIHSERLAAMGQLAASIVHELNNPLMILIGYMDLTLMMKDQMPDDGNKYLNIARQQADSMNQLIRDISNFSKSQVTPFGAVQVNELITQLVVFLGSILRKNIKIDAQDLASDLPPVWGSAQRIQQIFTNILTNAADALTNDGTVRIKAKRCSSQDVRREMKEVHQHSALSEEEVEPFLRDDSPFVFIQFTDDGSGIPDEVITNIFNPFFTTKPVDKGTGLGLSICRTIIERHRGNILVSCVIDHGTTFTVLLPGVDDKEKQQD
ncbi:MAG: ATP-binding protein [Candidatus Latescibacteria bacterium]|nr:ATP-binding protein [Candidatus Latescibacterota bacterium]MDP7238089.1 ATP-binding protein [Candidatus Latescibacterota bacterium]